MEYDPSQFVGAAPYYLAGRPPYSERMAEVLAAEVGLDGTGELVDVGCGPGTVGVELAPYVGHVTLLDPDAGMLAEARRHAADRGVGDDHVTFVGATAERLPGLGLPPLRLATFGQSFHRTDRLAVANAVHDLLEPGGSMVLVNHDHPTPGSEQPGRPERPAGTGDIPHAAIRDLAARYSGGVLRSGSRPVADYVGERFEETLARSRFGGCRRVVAPGRADLVRDVDGVVAGVLSMSYAAPGLLGDRLDAFVADLEALLAEANPDGRFWDWPGDTELLIATRWRG